MVRFYFGLLLVAAFCLLTRGGERVLKIQDETSFLSLVPDQSSQSFKFDRVVLLKDISISDVNNFSSHLPFGSEGSECIPFNGTVDGQRHTINNMIVSQENGAALFCGLKNAVVKNLVISSSCLFEGTWASAISMKAYGSVTFENVTNQAEVRGMRSAGAFIADVVDVNDSIISITNSRNEANMSFYRESHNEYSAGGFIGTISNTQSVTVYFTYSESNETLIGQKHQSVGGFVGRASGNTNMQLHFRECSVEYPMSKINNGNYHIYHGGFVGQIENNTNVILSIEDLHSKGNTTTYHYCYMGGFAGSIENNDNFTLSVNTLEIDTDVYVENYDSPKCVGGFTGALINNTHSTVQVSGFLNRNFVFSQTKSYCGGFVGYAGDDQDMTFIFDTFNTSMIIDFSNADGSYYNGGVFGYMKSNKNTTTTFKNGASKSTTTTKVKCSIGGFIGRIEEASDTNVHFFNCTHTGSIKTSNQDTEVGGFVGEILKGNGENTSLSFTNCVNDCNIVSQKQACGFFCVEDPQNNNVQTTVNNCINRGDISGKEEYGIANVVTNATNVINMGSLKSNGQSNFGCLWNTVDSSSFSYSLKSACSVGLKSTKPFYNNSGSFCINEDGPCNLLSTVLNEESQSKDFGMMWTEDLTLVNVIRIVVGVPKSCNIQTFSGDSLDTVSKRCDFSLDDFIVVEGDMKNPLTSTTTFTEDTKLRLCHEIVFRGVNKSDIVEHGTTLGDVDFVKDYVPPRFHVNEVGRREEDFDRNIEVVRNMTIDVVEWFLFTASGLVNHSQFVPPRTTLGTVEALAPYFNASYAVVDMGGSKAILNETTIVVGNMSVAVKNVTRLELELELELDGSDTGSEARDRLEEAIRDLVDGAVGDIDIIDDGSTFIVRITVVDDGDAEVIKDTLFSCTTKNKNNN